MEEYFMQNFFLALLFLAGVVVAGTANLQFTIGAVLMVVAYTELRKKGVDLDKIDDIILEKVREVTTTEETNEQK